MPSTRAKEAPVPPAPMTPATPVHTIPRQPAARRRADEQRATLDPRSPAQRAPAELLAPRLRLRLSSGKTFELAGKHRYLIGRRDERRGISPEVDLEDWNGAASGVSREHAMIYVTPEGVFIEDLESINETHINNCRLLAGQRYPLADGEQLRLGAVTLYVLVT
ncbi:MAG: FHA domain-containing protein [Ktedonobacterales bacterium]